MPVRSSDGVGLRLAAAMVTKFQFSGNDVVPSRPAGLPSAREWVQINRAEGADYEKALPLVQASREFVKTGRVS